MVTVNCHARGVSAQTSTGPQAQRERLTRACSQQPLQPKRLQRALFAHLRPVIGDASTHASAAAPPPPSHRGARQGVVRARLAAHRRPPPACMRPRASGLVARVVRLTGLVCDGAHVRLKVRPLMVFFSTTSFSGIARLSTCNHELERRRMRVCSCDLVACTWYMRKAR